MNQQLFGANSFNFIEWLRFNAWFHGPNIQFGSQLIWWVVLAGAVVWDCESLFFLSLIFLNEMVKGIKMNK